MDQHLVFAISREYGSGGREIGERLASELGIAYYDKLLLKRIAEGAASAATWWKTSTKSPCGRCC